MVEVEVIGLESAVRDLERYARLEGDLIAICRRLAEMGCDIARAAYLRGADVFDQDDVDVRVVPLDDGAEIVASGQSVFFLEFGAGIYAQTNEMNTEGLDTSPGSWSKTHKQIFTRYGYWFHKRQFYRGVVPAPGMNMAREEVLKNIEAVIAEVLAK